MQLKVDHSICTVLRVMVGCSVGLALLSVCSEEQAEPLARQNQRILADTHTASLPRLAASLPWILRLAECFPHLGFMLPSSRIRIRGA